jgi:hypothetical protein
LLATGSAGLTISGTSGNVGIGTTSPNISAGASGSTALTISASTADNSNKNGLLELRGTRSGTGNIVSYMRTFNNSATTPMTDIQSIRGSTDTLGEMAFSTSNSEKMRIDASGNLFVGTTTLSYSTAGARIRPFGQIASTISNGSSLSLNRLSSDGSIIDFSRDGTAVGNIGVWNNDNISLYGNSSHAGIGMATNSVEPIRNNAPADNSVDLGVVSARFKDLYLSGGVYLGGTGAANKLDDYEEGTWSIGLTFGGASVGMTILTNNGAYTKVGNLVTCTGYFALSAKGSSTGDAVITGLPFTVSNTNGGYSALSIRNIRISFADILDGNTVKDGTTINLNEATNAGVISAINNANFADNSGFIISVTYRTD